MSPDLIPDYENIERLAWRENAQKVVSRLEAGDSGLAKRIDTFVGRFGYSRPEVEEKIINDPMFAANFAKEPRRTGLHQKEAAKWLQGLDAVSEFFVLPASGNRALYVTSDGEIQSGAILKGSKPSKSLDFQWLTGSVICYAMHKYTREGGGNQDSQYKEMRDLLRNFQSCSNRECLLIVIVDGPYYSDQRMDLLRNDTRSRHPRSYAVHLVEVPEILDEYVKWEIL